MFGKLVYKGFENRRPCSNLKYWIYKNVDFEFSKKKCFLLSDVPSDSYFNAIFLKNIVNYLTCTQENQGF